MQVSYKNPLIYIIFLLFISLLFLNLSITSNQHFVYLANSFKEGSFSFVKTDGNFSDLSYFEGKYYWPLGPFPAVLITPFTFVNENFYQSFLSFPTSVLVFILLYKIATNLNLDKKRSTLLAVFFVFGSIYTPLAALPASWYFSQVLVCFLTIAAIYTLLFKKNYFLAGVFFACAIATRFSLIFAIVFFIILIISESEKFRKLIYFSLPVFTSVCLILLYNYLRFNNPLESGYNYQLIPEEPLARRNIGLFSIKHIPSNIYYTLFKGPEAVFKNDSKELKPPYITFDNYGLSIFFLSPILLTIYKANFKRKLIKTSAVASLLLLIPIWTYYGIGQKQVGYRYALDFFPFAFLILVDAVKKVDYKLMLFLVFWGVFFSMLFSIFYLGGLDV